MMASVTKSGHTTEPEKYFDPFLTDGQRSYNQGSSKGFNQVI